MASAVLHFFPHILAFLACPCNRGFCVYLIWLLLQELQVATAGAHMLLQGIRAFLAGHVGRGRDRRCCLLPGCTATCE